MEGRRKKPLQALREKAYTKLKLICSARGRKKEEAYHEPNL